jgi:hypothetical protein
MWYKQRLMAQVNGKELFGQLVKELSSDDRTGPNMAKRYGSLIQIVAYCSPHTSLSSAS